MGLINCHNVFVFSSSVHACTALHINMGLLKKQKEVAVLKEKKKKRNGKDVL